MTTPLRVHLLPALVEPEQLVGCHAVVIDVLRASTTITAALDAGARCVIPCREVAAARQAAAERPAGETLLGGEREGLPIEGFDLGNSPSEYIAETVSGRDVVFTTTNGTAAIERCRLAASTRVAAFVNVSAVIEAVAELGPLHVVCAGTRGHVAREDTLLAGFLVDQLTARAVDRFDLNDSARIAHDTWLHVHARLASPDALAPGVALLKSVLSDCAGGQNLKQIDLEKDIETAATVDLYACVPEWDSATGSLVAR